MNSDASPVVTRFAPSPTGYLHIGGARTALFNWLYARSKGGKYLLRIEDTDRKRSSDDAIQAILDGLEWLGIDWDDEPVFQSARQPRHAEMVEKLLQDGNAYRCYATPEELKEMRETARAEGHRQGYDGRWRDRDPAEAPEGVAPTVRLRSPRDGETVIQDQVQGEVRVANEELDDMVLLRGDGTPTYMLSVVVDDHDMGITHVVRGDDHLTNAFRQTQLYEALGWQPPTFAHIPLIHGPDGAKLSKRHGALGIEAYRDMGYLPAALRNYLCRLGWGHGDDEIFTTEQATEWFTLEAVNKGPSRFDFKKLENLNGVYIREGDDTALVENTLPFVEEILGRALGADEKARFRVAMSGLKARAKTLVELAENAAFYFKSTPLDFDEKATNLLQGDAGIMVGALGELLAKQSNWDADTLEVAVRAFAESKEHKLGKVCQPLRAALTGRATSPGIFEVLEILGREESLMRVEDARS